MPHPLLEGKIECADETEFLHARNKKLEEQLREARERLALAENEMISLQSGVAGLRRQLAPLFSSLKALFGEMDRVAGADMPPGPSPSQPIPAIAFEAWKKRLPPSCGKIIDALLIQPLNNTQLKSMCKLGNTSVIEGLSILRKNNLVDKDSGGLNRLRAIP